MYNRKGIAQSRALRQRSWDPSSPGALVALEEDPYWLTSLLAREPDLSSLRSIYQIPDHVLERVKERAQSILDSETGKQILAKKKVEYEASRKEIQTRIDQLRERRKEHEQAIRSAKKAAAQKLAESGASHSERETVLAEIREMSSRGIGLSTFGEKDKIDSLITRLEQKLSSMQNDYHQQWWDIFDARRQRMEHLDEVVRTSGAVATTFRPLGLRAAAALLELGYHGCMVNSCLFLDDFGFFDCPSSEDFERIAGGKSRARSRL
jgi:hypothetical protein